MVYHYLISCDSSSPPKIFPLGGEMPYDFFIEITPICTEEIDTTTITTDDFSDQPWAFADSLENEGYVEYVSGPCDYSFHIEFMHEPGGVGNYRSL